MIIAFVIAAMLLEQLMERKYQKDIDKLNWEGRDKLNRATMYGAIARPLLFFPIFLTIFLPPSQIFVAAGAIATITLLALAARLEITASNKFISSIECEESLKRTLKTLARQRAITSTWIFVCMVIAQSLLHTWQQHTRG